MQTDTDVRFADSQVNLACFEVDGRLHAMDVMQVKEIIRCQEVTLLPNAPVLVEGVIDLRGRVIPVLDLSRALGGGGVPDSTRARIVVIECDGLSVGLRVAAAIDVLSLPTTALEDPPALTAQAGYETVRAVVRREGSAPVTVLSVESILESVYRSAARADASTGSGPVGARQGGGV